MIQISTRFRQTLRTPGAWLCFSLSIGSIQAQRDLEEVPEPNPEAELAAFTVAEGFEINLFAATPLIAKPTQISFDDEGKLWVSGSHIYPQLNVNEKPSDQVVILNDSNGDGVADESSVFYDELIIPGGVLPDGKGGAYVAHADELLYLHDTDGDGRADRKEVLLSGFGTEDTHHTLHRLSWGPDGKLYMLQGYYIGSHVETLYGPRRLNGGGLWSYDTETRRLEIYSRGLVNPWGLDFDYWGQSFQTDGAGSGGVTYSFPDTVFLASPGEPKTLPNLLSDRPKHCGITIISGRHFPEAWQTDVITSDFRAHNIDRYAITQKGSAYEAELKEDLLISSHKSFRPIDTVMGPDGALYIADWYNPIIQHGEVDFRDGRRDHGHGRIWRITAINRPLLDKPDYKNPDIDALLDLLKAEENWVRLFAKQELKQRKSHATISRIEAWIQKLDPADENFEHHRVEALWALRTIGSFNEDLLKSVAESKSSEARAAAIRILYHDHEKANDALAILERAVKDSNAQVRREAITSLGQCASVEAFQTVLGAYGDQMEDFYEFALWRSCRLLEPYWMPAFQRGDLKIAPDSQALNFALMAIDTNDAAKILITRFRDAPDTKDSSILKVIGRSGDSEDLNFLTEVISGPQSAFYNNAAQGLLTAASERAIYPTENREAALKNLLEVDQPQLQAIAFDLVAHWQSDAFLDEIKSKFTAQNTHYGVRKAASRALVSLNKPEVRDFLIQATGKGQHDHTRTLAALSLVQIDVAEGAKGIAEILADDQVEIEIGPIVHQIVRKEGVFHALATALKGKTMPSETAREVSQAIQTTGRAGSEELLIALAKAGSLESPLKLNVHLKTIDLMTKIAQGDVEKGKEVYHRPGLTCVVCHKVNGEGLSDLGPDLGSIGASAPLDYIIESLLDPSKKIKEGYRSTIITTKNGDFYGGAIQKEDSNIVLLKTATGTDVTVKKSDIKSVETSKVSMMAPGLTASLPEDELLDLLSYLASLGTQK
ncbi:MAG: putative heme-binding domain-containing protein [Verrucomicrobiales bacterium]|jgi:putative heme-binding domain-containing protein